MSTIVIVIIVVVAVVVMRILLKEHKAGDSSSQFSADTHFVTFTMDRFLNDMEKEKPIMFTSEQLNIATDNYSNMLGSGGFGTVYKGVFSDGTIVAVKVLNGSSDKRIQEQFMAEVKNYDLLFRYLYKKLRTVIQER